MLFDAESEARLKMIYFCAEGELICTLHLLESISEAPKTFIKGCQFCH